MRQEVKVMAELDAILDTRLGVLDSIDSQKAIKAFDNEDYYFRLTDDFSSICDISQAQFKEAWVGRDIEVLKKSIISPTIFVIKTMLTQMELKALNSPVAPIPVLKVNCWPYDLTSEEMNLIRQAIANYSGVTTRIEMNSYPPSEVGLARLKRENYGGLFVYDFQAWLKGSLEDLKKTQDPRFMIFTPSVLPMKGWEDQFKQLDLPKEMDPLKLIEGAFAEFFALDYMPTFMFSIYRPDKHDEWVNKAYSAIILPPDQHPFLRVENELEDKLAKDGTLSVDPDIQVAVPEDVMPKG